MLNVCFAADDNYVPFLGVSIVSLIENNQEDFDKINIFILDDGITSKNKKRIESLINNSNHNLYFIKTKNLNDLEIELYSLGENQGFSFTTYSRLFISSLLPSDTDKIIYLDCDALILGSFKELWMRNIDDYSVGGVLDVIPDSFKIMLGFKLEDSYINAGFLLINLKKWRQDHVEEKFIQFMVENQNRFYMHDQDILNNVFKDQVLILNPEYNFFSRFQVLGYDLTRKYRGMKLGKYYSKDIINHAKQNLIFVHFCGGGLKELWGNKNHPYRNLYMKYSEIAGFKEELIEEDSESPLFVKLVYNSIHNPISKFILKIIPTYFVYKMIHHNMGKHVKNAEKKHKKLSEVTNYLGNEV